MTAPADALEGALTEILRLADEPVVLADQRVFVVMGIKAIATGALATYERQQADLIAQQVARIVELTEELAERREMVVSLKRQAEWLGADRDGIRSKLVDAEAKLEAAQRQHADAMRAIVELREAKGGIVRDDWTPTAANVNALPGPVFRYISGLETNADPGGMLRDNIMLKDQSAAMGIALAAAHDRIEEAQRLCRILLDHPHCAGLRRVAPALVALAEKIAKEPA